MVNAQNLRFPIQPVGDLSRLSIPGPFDTPNYLNLPDSIGFDPRQSPRPRLGEAQKDDFWQRMLGSLEGDLSEAQSQFGGSVAQRKQIAGQIMGAKPPDPAERKRVPQGTQLLTGGIGLLLRALGASHESVIGGVGTALSGMQQRLDEETERENTKRFNEYNASMKNLEFAYKEAVLQSGLDSDAVKTTREQIDKLKLSIDKQLDADNKFILDARTTIDELFADRKLTRNALDSWIEMAKSRGINLMENEDYWDYQDKAVEFEKEMGAVGKAEAEKKLNDAIVSFKAIEKMETDNRIGILNEQQKTLELRLATDSYDSDLARMKDEAEIARLKKELLAEELKYLPEKQRQEKQRAADLHANSLATRAKIAADIGRINQLNANDRTEAVKGLDKDFGDIAEENAEKRRKLDSAKSRAQSLRDAGKSTAEIEGTIDNLQAEIDTNDETLNRNFDLISDQALRERLFPHLVRAGTKKPSESRSRGPRMQGG